MGGKTTNVKHIYSKTANEAKGEFVSLNTESDRTLFYDFLPLGVGTIRGYKTRIHLYTVPGQVFYVSSRRIVLKGVDGVIFVADSQVDRLEENKAALKDFYRFVKSTGKDPKVFPQVFQYNKRDLKNICPKEELSEILNPSGFPEFEAVASEGVGVFESLKSISRQILKQISSNLDEHIPAN
jgi:signal recognition particle receptor subunit beta